jgi:serine/threonine protein kinase
MGNFFNALPLGTCLNEYQIIKVIGGGGFGVTYLARNNQLNQLVAIKEYFPNEMAVREHSYQIKPATDQDNVSFSWGLERFIQEARILAKFNHPNIIRVLNFFYANNTGYIVMEYEKGRSLADALENGETATEDEIMSLLPSLLDGLKHVHAHSLLHRDIKPANIYIRDRDNTPVLLDFGSARYDVSRHSRPMTSIVTRGYAPFEQYTTDSKQQGPWTDIYSVGAVLYRSITGILPPESTKRLGAVMKQEHDPLVAITKLVKKKFNRNLLKGIEWGLAVLEKDRPQSIDAWKTVILDNNNVSERNFFTRFLFR